MRYPTCFYGYVQIRLRQYLTVFLANLHGIGMIDAAYEMMTLSEVNS